ncbi:hypothetical protein [Necropsobacter massiliensis]|uniref:hypothetical protein n=1 Tax=Necropsobacter massiliensis TaxID=1400001 RepID=UPI000595CB45|nr:hypothetical protein [Necropsobacter massiliensis]
MKCAIAKHTPLILIQAVRHYQKSAQIFTFPSLYDDFEPYPIKEVVDVLKLKASDLERAIDAHPLNESLKTSFYTTQKHLIQMQKRLKEMTQ